LLSSVQGLQHFTPGRSVVVVGDVIPACISSGRTRQTVSNTISE